MKCKYCGEFYDSSLAHSHKCSPFERDELKRALDKASAPMTTPPLPSWPAEKPEHLGLANASYWEAYERARADAWEARCRVAVALLQRLTGHYECDDCWYSCSTICCDENRKSDECDCGAQRVADVLATIGPLPPLPPQQQRTGE